MELFEIIIKLVGPVHPAGASHIDPERLENLKKMKELTHDLIQEIQYVSRYKDNVEYSMKEAGKCANNFMTSIIGNFDLECNEDTIGEVLDGIGIESVMKHFHIASVNLEEIS